MKKFVFMMTAMILFCSLFSVLTGCGCEHEWSEATCLSPAVCKICGKTEGTTTEHKWKEATCSAPKTCSVCGKTEGNALAHKWKEATCSAPKTCSVCGKTEGTVAEHKWKEATCTTPKTCSVCGKTEGTVAEHKWKEATCTTPKTCSVCGKTEGGIKHSVGIGTCPKCGQKSLELIDEASDLLHSISTGTSKITLSLDYIGDFMHSQRETDFDRAKLALKDVIRSFEKSIELCGSHPEFSTIKGYLKDINNSLSSYLSSDDKSGSFLDRSKKFINAVQETNEPLDKIMKIFQTWTLEE